MMASMEEDTNKPKTIYVPVKREFDAVSPRSQNQHRRQSTTAEKEVLASSTVLKKDLALEEPTGLSKEPATKFSLQDIANTICDNPPEFLDVRDEQLSLALLEGMERCLLDDMVSWFLHGEGIHADEKVLWGPPKWNYSKEDPYDSFDYYVATGCPNCGSPYELEQSYAYHLNPPTLVCLQCGHRACQLHLRGEGESFVDRLETNDSSSGNTSAASNDTPLSVFTAQKSQMSSEEGEDSAVYVRGVREQYDFGQKGKEWWQNRYLPRAIRLKNLYKTITMIATMSKLKAPTIKELCEVCENTEAYYTTYQARSADEGMTIMFECTRCHHRKTFNN